MNICKLYTEMGENLGSGPGAGGGGGDAYSSYWVIMCGFSAGLCKLSVKVPNWAPSCLDQGITF